jgi:UDP-N-acetylmuramoyl-tripeptide--D-alanyl-D-alanine ligase
MAMNALAALAAATALGLDACKAAKALSAFVPLSGRGAHRRLMLPGGAALLLDESYNANGASMRAALDVLRLQPAKRRVAILGDMLELGDAGPAEHAALAADTVRAADVVFACGPLMRHLFEALPVALRGGHAPDAAALAPVVAERIAAGDAILIKGSLGSRMKTIVAALDARADNSALDARAVDLAADARAAGAAQYEQATDAAPRARAGRGAA